MKSYGIYSILVALMASSCSREVSPRSVAGEGKSYTSDGFALAASVSGYSLHAESEYASGVPQTGAKDEFVESDRGNVLILQYRTSGSPVSGGVAKLEKDGTGADTIPDACVGQAACPEAGIYNPNPIRGSVAIRVPATGSLKKFKVRGASDAAGLSVKEAVAGSSSGGSSSGGSSSGGSSSGGSSSGDNLVGGACQALAAINTWLATNPGTLTQAGGSLVSSINDRFCVHTVTDGSTALSPYLGSTTMIAGEEITNGTKIAIANVRGTSGNDPTAGNFASLATAEAACAALTLDGASPGEWRLPASSMWATSASNWDDIRYFNNLESDWRLSAEALSRYLGVQDAQNPGLYTAYDWTDPFGNLLLDPFGQPQVMKSPDRFFSMTSANYGVGPTIYMGVGNTPTGGLSGVLCIKAPSSILTLTSTPGPHTCQSGEAIDTFIRGNVTRRVDNLHVNGTMVSGINDRFCLHTVTDPGPTMTAPGLQIAISDQGRSFTDGPMTSTAAEAQEVCAALTIGGASPGQWRLPLAWTSPWEVSYNQAPSSQDAAETIAGYLQNYTMFNGGVERSFWTGTYNNIGQFFYLDYLTGTLYPTYSSTDKKRVTCIRLP